MLPVRRCQDRVPQRKGRTEVLNSHGAHQCNTGLCLMPATCPASRKRWACKGILCTNNLLCYCPHLSKSHYRIRLSPADPVERGTACQLVAAQRPPPPPDGWRANGSAGGVGAARGAAAGPVQPRLPVRAGHSARRAVHARAGERRPTDRSRCRPGVGCHNLTRGGASPRVRRNALSLTRRTAASLTPWCCSAVPLTPWCVFPPAAGGQGAAAARVRAGGAGGGARLLGGAAGRLHRHTLRLRYGAANRPA